MSLSAFDSGEGAPGVAEGAGDSAARASFYQTMTQIGGMTINEVRRLENLPPVAGGDEVRMQMQNVPISEAGNADQAS